VLQNQRLKDRLKLKLDLGEQRCFSPKFIQLKAIVSTISLSQVMLGKDLPLMVSVLILISPFQV
jgi:hypothetical protein